MHVEIQVALNFLISFLYNKLPRRRVNQFAEELEQIVRRKFDGHWYPEEPYKGSAYRCIHCNPLLDSSLFREAAHKSGLNLKDVQDNLPHELSVWIDPGEVSYRISEKSPVIILYGSPKMDRLKPNAELGLNPEAQCFRPIVVSSSANGNNNATTMMMMFENNSNNNDTKPQQFAMNNHQNKLSDEIASANPNQPQTLSVANATPPTPPGPINVLATFNAKQEPITFTTAAFAATKFGSTKPKTQICKKNYPRTTMPMAMNENSNNHHLQNQFNNPTSKFPPRKCLNNVIPPVKDVYAHCGAFKNRSFTSNNTANNNSSLFNTNADAFIAYNANNSNASHQNQQLSALQLDNKKANRNSMMMGWPSINQETIMKGDNDDESIMSINGLMMCSGDGPSNTINGISSLEQLLASTNPNIDHIAPPKMKNIDTNSTANNDYIDQYNFYKYCLPHNTNSSEQMLDDLVTPHFTVANEGSEDDSNFSINSLANFLGGMNIDLNAESDTPFMADQLLREIFDMATATNDNLNINHNKNDDENNDPNYHHHHQRQVPNKMEQNVGDRNTETSNDLIDCGSGFTLSSSSWSSNELSSSAIINEFDNLSLNSNSSSSLGSVSSFVA